MGAAQRKEEEDIEAQEGEELLPLYTENEEQDKVDNDAELKLPRPDASPHQVRKFLFQLLRQRGVESDLASAAAAKWTLGSGAELRAYDEAMYQSVLGAEYGYILYKDVHEDMKVESYWKSKKEMGPMFCIMFMGLLFSGATVAIFAAGPKSFWAILLGVMFGLFAFVLIGGALSEMCTIFGRPPPGRKPRPRDTSEDTDIDEP